MPFLFDEKLIETLLWFEKQQTGGYGMQMEQYENRKNYVESVKTALPHRGKRLIRKNMEKRPRSFLGLRFVLGTFSVFMFPWHASDRFFLAFLERRKDYTADPKFHQIPSDSGSIKPVIKV